jgi:Arc/MetJ-type ribon-helix-helix transcriptional regulator
MTPEASDTLEILKARLTEENKGYFVSTSEVIRRAIMYLEFHTRTNNAKTK